MIKIVKINFFARGNMATTNTNTVDLINLFGSVAKTLTQNQTALNEADTYNHDHGDNMVQIFDLITKAMQEKKSAPASDQLAHAAAVLGTQAGSGSAKLYAEGLKDAAAQFTGQKSISAENGMQLVQTLLGAANTLTQGAATSGNASGGADLLGSLLGGLAGAAGGESAQAGENAAPSIDLGDILNAGAAFMQTKQSGGSNLDAIVNALVSGSKVGNQDYRAQSGTLVANTLMQVISQMAAAKK